MAHSYQLYPCTNAEQLFAAVRQHSHAASLQVDFGQSKFLPQPRLLFQNNALGEWFKVWLADDKGISIGLKVSYSKEVLEHYLRLFFPELQSANWVHAEVVSLLVYQLLQAGQESRYLPLSLKDLKRQVQPTAAKFVGGTQALDSSWERQLWGFAQEVAGLFITYDNYREQLRDALALPSDAASGSGQAWQAHLWYALQKMPGLHWHGKLIDQVLQQNLQPQTAEPLEPLYIIGSGFLSAVHLAFYQHLAQFTPVRHFWLAPAQFPRYLREEAAKMLYGQSPYDRHRLSECVGGLPEFLWLENSLHSASLLSHAQEGYKVQWQPYAPEQSEPQHSEGKASEEPLPLLRRVQQYLRYSCEARPNPNLASIAGEAADGSIRYFACSDKRREVEVLKDQILAELDANPHWQLNDIAVLAPDINQYQSLIQSVFQKSDVRLHCNFIDLRLAVALGKVASSGYLAAFTSLLELSDFTLDKCLRLLENPCVRASDWLHSKPDSFWRKILRHWQLSQSTAAETSQGTASGGAFWQQALSCFISDYLNNYAASSALARQLSLDQSEAELLAETLQSMLRLCERLAPLQTRLCTIAEWVRQLESLQDEFLCCRSKEAQSDRDILSTALRNFLAIEESMQQSLASSASDSWRGSVGKAAQPRFTFSLVQSLLQQTLEQNFSFKGRYLTQGVTCASLQPYRSVPFRMICVLGLNEKDFPRSSVPLRFDLCITLPQHLSRQAQEQHIFAELLISARERLLLFYQDRDLTTGNPKSPSASLGELCYCVAKMLQTEEARVWQQLLQQHPLFPFDRKYFTSAEFFSYSRSHYDQYLAWESAQHKAAQPQATRPQVQGLSASGEPCPLRYDFGDLLAAICDAPSYFWQHYSGLDTRFALGELPLSEQLPQENDLLAASLEPLSCEKWQLLLWNDMDYLLAVLRLDNGGSNGLDNGKQNHSSPDIGEGHPNSAPKISLHIGEEPLRSLLQAEGLLGSSQLLGEQQWQSLRQGLHSLKAQLQQWEHWPGWDFFCDGCQYSICLQQGSSARLLLNDVGAATNHSGQWQGAFLLPALRCPLAPEVEVVLEVHIPRVWLSGKRALLWNKSPFGVPAKLYALLQRKLFGHLVHSLPSSCEPHEKLYSTWAEVKELLQLEWVYSKGLQAELHSIESLPEPNSIAPATTQPRKSPQTKTQTELYTAPTLEDYIWLLWRAACEPLPLTKDFLALLKAKDSPLKEPLTGLQKAFHSAQPTQTHLPKLQCLLLEQWKSYLYQVDSPSEALQHLTVDFANSSLQQPRFWLLLQELIGL